jgi:hypothetical protein
MDGYDEPFTILQTHLKMKIVESGIIQVCGIPLSSHDFSIPHAELKNNSSTRQHTTHSAVSLLMICSHGLCGRTQTFLAVLTAHTTTSSYTPNIKVHIPL